MPLPPGPSSLKEFFHMLVQRKKNPIRLYENVFKKYGDLVYFEGAGEKFLMVNDAEVIEQVLHTEARNFTKSTGYERFKLIVGNGLLVSEGDIWKKQRRLLSWAFSPKHIEKIHPVMMSQSLEMVERWKKETSVDLAEEMNYTTLQVISTCLFGKDQNQNSKNIRNALQIMLTYLQTTRHLWIQLFLSIIPFIDKKKLALRIESSLPLNSTKRFFSAIKMIDDLVLSMIKERKDIGKSEFFLDTLIQATDSEDQSHMNSTQLRDEVVNMLIAGHETTANAMTWTWHQLLKYPRVMEKVREEIMEKVKGAAPTHDELSQLKYTLAVLEESMRLYPPFWRISRKNIAPMNIKNFDIPAGTNVIISIYTVHRKEEYWDDPLLFNPDRFLNTSTNDHRFKFIPFGAGPRACIGAHMATIEALTILSTCIKHFEFEKKFTQDPEYFVSLTLQPKDGCKVKLKGHHND